MMEDTSSMEAHRRWQQVVRVCPPDVQHKLSELPARTIEQIEELRFRLSQPLQLIGASIDAFLGRDSGLSSSVDDGFVVTEQHLQRIVQMATQASLYAVEDELRRGFITMPGGHRVGVAGRIVLSESGRVRTVRSISSVNIRVARQQIGAADAVIPHLINRASGRPYNTLIISPPQCGKTTLLRDLARQWSEGRAARAAKVTVVDERSEIAGSIDGVPQFQLGPRSDVLDACPKAEGMLMAIRSLSPDIVVTDEIGRLDDRDAVLEATHAGVTVVASAHAASLEEWCARPYMTDLYKAQAFARYVLLSRRRGPGTIEQVLSRTGERIWHGPTSAVRVDAP